MGTYVDLLSIQFTISYLASVVISALFKRQQYYEEQEVLPTIHKHALNMGPITVVDWGLEGIHWDF